MAFDYLDFEEGDELDIPEELIMVQLASIFGDRLRIPPDSEL